MKFRGPAATEVLITDIPQNIPFDNETGTVNFANRAAAGLEPFPAFPYDVALGRPAWRQAMTTPFQVYDIPGTAPNLVSVSHEPLGSDKLNAIVETYAGAALRTQGSTVEYLMHSGGHGNSSGNHIIGCVLSEDAPVCAIRRQPSLNSDVTIDTRRYLDGTPSASHNYYSLFHDSTRDEMHVVGPQAVYGTGNSCHSVLERCDLTTNTWRPTGECPAIAGVATRAGEVVVQHPETGHYYFCGNNNTGNNLYKVDISTLTRSTVGPLGFNNQGIYGAMAIDPTRGEILRSKDSESGSVWKKINIATGAATTFTLSGDVPNKEQANTLLYFQRTDRYYWITCGQSAFGDLEEVRLYEIHPTTGVCTRKTLTGTNPGPGVTHMFSKAKIAYDGIVWAHKYNQPLKFIPLI